MMMIHQVERDNLVKKGESGMPNDQIPKVEAAYEIRVMGKLDPSWSV